jgi:hypothetical protein
MRCSPLTVEFSKYWKACDAGKIVDLPGGGLNS